MSTTALLVRWAQGYFQIAQPGATVREEGYLKAGSSQSAEDATELATALLDRVAEREESITAAVEGAFTGAIGATLIAPDLEGNAATWRIVGVNYTQDDEGHVTRVPILELVP